MSSSQPVLRKLLLRLEREGKESYHVRCCTQLNCSETYCTALSCVAMHCTALYCTAFNCTQLHCFEIYCTALHCTVLHSVRWELGMACRGGVGDGEPCTALHCTVIQTTLHCTAQHRTSGHYKALHCTALLHCTMHCTAQYTSVQCTLAPDGDVKRSPASSSRLIRTYDFLVCVTRRPD